MAGDMKAGFSPNLASSSEQPLLTVTLLSDVGESASSGATVPQQGATQYSRQSGVPNLAASRRVLSAPSRVVSGLQHVPEFTHRDP